MRASVALLISSFAAQQVAATWDRKASNYNTPTYNNNECTDKQKGGYNWADLNDGDKPGKYDDFDFGGDWSCSTKKFGKRDHLSKRTFGAKAITNTCGKEKPASFSCNQKPEGFSVTHIDVSVDHDADLDFHYKMKDGSICKHRASCKKEGTTVQNTQCGGAESVDVYLGHSSEGRDNCEIGVHQIGFDCNPGESYTPPPPYTPAPPPSTSEAPPSSTEVVPPPETPTLPPQTSDSPPPPESTSVSIKTPICGYGSCGSTGYSNSTAPPSPPETPVTSEVPSSSAPAESTSEVSSSAPAESTPALSTPAESSSVETTTPPPAETTPTGECGGYGQPACETSTPAESTPVESTPAESTPVESAPAESTPVESAPAESTPAESTPAESTEVPSSTGVPPASTPSGECGGYGQPACETPASSAPASSAPAESTTIPYGTAPSVPASSSPPTVTPPPGGYTPPECLPKCLNTWLKLKTECKDNTDSECYCKVPELTDNVIDCVKAYGTEEEVQQALSFFVGICAPHVPENPGIIDKCTGALNPPKPTPTPEAPVSSAPAEYPVSSAASEVPVSSAPAEVPASSGASEVPVSSAPAGYPASSGAPEAPASTPSGECGGYGQPACEAPISSAPAEVPASSAAPEAPASTPSGECGGYGQPACESPVTSAPAGYPASSAAPESPVTPAPESSEAPATSAGAQVPGSTPAPAAPVPEMPTDIPYTTISYGGSSYTVPQVGFTTEAPGAPGANPTEPIALYPVAPTPAPAPANPTAPYPIPSGASGFTSVAYPTGTGAVPSAPGQFTGAASSLNVKSKGVGMVAGAILAFFAL